MARIHLMMQVADLQESIQFYSALFRHEPTKVKEDYAQWKLDNPSVNLSIVPSSNGKTGLEHLGLEAGTPEELEQIQSSAQETDRLSLDEGETVCCYAASRKQWFKDPEGIEWEIFYTHADSETFHAEEKAEKKCC